MNLIEQTSCEAPDIVNPTGEEIWTHVGRNMALVRLRPGTSSEEHFHKLTKEWYSLIQGRPTLYLNGEEAELVLGKPVEIEPQVIHHILNKTDDDVYFLVQGDRKWDPSDQYLI